MVPSTLLAALPGHGVSNGGPPLRIRMAIVAGLGNAAKLFGRGTDNVAVIHGRILHGSVPHGTVEEFSLHVFVFIRNGCDRCLIAALKRFVHIAVKQMRRKGKSVPAGIL